MLSSDQHPILITGISGYVGFNTVYHFLSQGHVVRAAVRSKSNIPSILGNEYMQEFSRHLSFVEVSNFQDPREWTDALKGVTRVVHIASPNSKAKGPDLRSAYIEQPVASMMGLLKACHTQPASKLRRIVITSTVGAIAPLDDYFGTCDDPQIHQAEERVLPTPAFQKRDNQFLSSYMTGKIASLNETEAWIAKSNPTFDVVHIMPGVVSGFDRRAIKKSDLWTSTAYFPLAVALPERPEDTEKLLTFQAAKSAMVHVDDVAKLHELVLDESVVPLRPGDPQTRSFISNCQIGPVDFATIPGILQRHFPGQVQTGVLPCRGEIPTRPFRSGYDPTSTERTLTFHHRSFEEIVVEIVWQYLYLKD